MKYNTYTGDPIIHNNKKVNRGQLLSPAACMLINKVCNDACQWNGHDVVISIGGIFLQNALYVAWHTKKSWAFSDLVAVISAAFTRLLFVVNTLTVLLSFCYIESELFSCIYKDFVRQLKAFLPSFCHLRAWEMNHLKGSLFGAFERHFGPGRGEFEQ